MTDGWHAVCKQESILVSLTTGAFCRQSLAPKVSEAYTGACLIYSMYDIGVDMEDVSCIAEEFH